MSRNWMINILVGLVIIFTIVAIKPVNIAIDTTSGVSGVGWGIFLAGVYNMFDELFRS